MKQFLLLTAVLAVTSAKSVGIGWTQVRPIEDTDQYWDRIPEELQYLRKQQPDRRIVNGQEAAPGQFPYQVFLRIQGENDRWSICGGSILNSNNILTAAHCVWRAVGGVAVVGAQNLDINEPSQQEIPFAKVFYHAGYNGESHRDDIAIVRLSSHITFNDRVKTVRLPARGDNRQFAGLTGTVSGFGTICSGCDSSEILLYTSNPIITNAECVAVWPEAGTILDSNVCVSVEGGRDSCQGDSGGPLTVIDGGSSLQIGVVSFGIGCGDKTPGVYARVTYYLDWILHVMTL